MEYVLGRHHGISWDRLGPSLFRFFGQGPAGTVSEDSFDYIDRTDVRVPGSSSETSEGVLHHDNTNGQAVFGRSLVDSHEDETLRQSQGGISSRVREIIPSTSTESDSETAHDIVFTSREACTFTSDGPGHDNTLLSQTDEQVGPRRHSWTAHIQARQSINVYSAHDEIHHAHIAPNVNPWARSMSETETQGNAGNTRLPITKQRSNSTPCCNADRVTKWSKECNSTMTCTTASHDPTPATSSLQENRSLFRHFTESSRSTRTRPRTKRRRPRNNPDHILEHGSSGYKEVNTQDSSGIETPTRAEYRETTL